MRRQINRNFLAIAAASALAACAANAPVGTSVKATGSASASKPVATAADDKKAAKGYRQVTKNGVEYFCRREAVTGSRTEVVDTCLTKAQMDSVTDSSQDLVRRLNSVPGGMPGADSNGGQTNTVMGR
jgi:hypothetical protein